jgi:hypothetical protein
MLLFRCDVHNVGQTSLGEYLLILSFCGSYDVSNDSTFLQDFGDMSRHFSC